MGVLDIIESPDELSKELRKDELLKRDVYNLVESITRYLPFWGLLSEGITTADMFIIKLKHPKHLIKQWETRRGRPKHPKSQYML